MLRIADTFIVENPKLGPVVGAPPRRIDGE